MTREATTGSSAMFSLRELMELEEQRVSDEEARARREAEARRMKADELQKRQLADAKARLDAEERDREARLRREREDQVRLDAIREAEIERRRILAEREAALIVQSQLATQEREAALRSNAVEVASARRTLALVLSASVLALLGLAFVYWGVLRPSFERKQADLDRARADQAESAANARREVDQLRRTIDAIERERSARTVPVVAAPKEPKDEPKVATAAVVRPTRPVVTPTGATTASDCATGDPMCVSKK